MLLIADISDFQAPLNPANYKSVGITGVISKVTESNTFVTKTHMHNMAVARDAGMIVGAYHFAHRGDPGQADWYVNHVADQWGGVEGIIHMLDVEQEASGKSPNIDDVRTFASRFRELTNNHPLTIYSGTWYWRDTIGNPKDTCGAHLVDARYVNGAGDPRQIVKNVTPGYWVPYGGWQQPLLRQFTCNARVPGEPFPVDVSVFWGTADELRAKTLRQPPPPAPWEKLPTVRLGDGMAPEAPNDTVKFLQASLNLLHTRPALIADGRFGPATVDAVQDFQTFVHTKDSTILVDGVVGQQTWRALYFFLSLA